MLTCEAHLLIFGRSSTTWMTTMIEMMTLATTMMMTMMTAKMKKIAVNAAANAVS
jgi:hypothetical protein